MANAIAEAENEKAEYSVRCSIIDVCKRMNSVGINQGKSGNVSSRCSWDESGDYFLITPSGVAYDKMKPDMIVRMSVEDGSVDCRSTDKGPAMKPSSEWRMHRDIYAKFKDAGAVVHAHPTFCTALACRQESIPGFHYMVAVAGGETIECTPKYYRFGTKELSDSMIEALRANQRACLLANHGMICYDRTLGKAFDLAVEVESLAKQYFYAASNGKVKLLKKSEMDEVLEAIKTYGKQDAGKSQEDAIVIK